MLLTFSSRQLRLSADDALVFKDEINLILLQNSGIDELVQYLNTSETEFSEQELRWAARLLGWRIYQKGHYSLSGNASYEELLSKLARGIQDPVPVVVLPGIDQARFSNSVASFLEFEPNELDTLFSDSLFLNELNLSKEGLFGRMLPETYLMYWTISPKDAIRRVLSEYQSNVVDVYSDSASAKEKSIDDILIMASIIEWEAKLEEEKATISGLYWNRINRRMRLEADPTVNFAIGERRRLLFEDYRVQHPYNTYLRRGLPPGPVTNPSLSTIRAALYPEEHDYLFMVANPEGGHIFTRTFEEHEKASEEWRRWLREQYRIARENESR